jgi:hypothetical protein
VGIAISEELDAEEGDCTDLKACGHEAWKARIWKNIDFNLDKCLRSVLIYTKY